MHRIDFQRTLVFPALQLKSAVKIAPIAAKVSNDAYNICSGHRRARIRDRAAQARRHSPDDRDALVDSHGSNL
jgi:hypothetical protein